MILVLLILALTGCSIGGEKKIKIFSVEEPRAKLNLPAPAIPVISIMAIAIFIVENIMCVFIDDNYA